ncbi:MAG: class I SAM-dependent methyltransferase [Chloroflexota bacterium]
MYDTFSDDYDRFVNWKDRLAGELPFIRSLLAAPAAGREVRVLDAACGTGMHAIALAQHGYTCAGADLSPAMIARARANAAAAGVVVSFSVAGFGALAAAFGGGFDALLCLGNSLPHLLTPEALAAALADFAVCLRPGGLLLIQNRNFDAVMASRQRWMEPQAYRQPALPSGGSGEAGGAAEWLFLRFYDFEPDGSITFNIVTLRRTGEAPWEQTVTGTRLRPLLHVEAVGALQAAGFERITAYGGLTAAAFDARSSGNLVLVAYKASS